MRELLLVAAGGAIGASARWAAGGWIADRVGPGFPWPTLVINITGALLIGLLMGASVDRALIGGDWRLFLGTGVLGGYTTFSTLAYESVRLMERGLMLQAGLNMFGSGVLGIVAAIVGLAIGRML